MSKKFLFFFAFIIFAAIFVSHQKTVDVLAAENQYQGATIPTRTPTPGPVANTPIPPTNDPSNPPAATETPQTPDQTPTSTLIPATLAATPIGGFLETAVPCAGNPTVQAINTTRVRQGPDTQYNIMAELVYLEVRPIIGRAAYAPWWLILLSDGRHGWVSDDVVQVQGYTGIVPIAEAPPLNGTSPTPGTPWQPTPNPTCTVTPIPTETATAVPSQTVPATATPVPEQVTPSIEPTDQPSTKPTAVPPTATATVIVQPTTAAETATPEATAVPLDGPDGSGGGSSFNTNILLIGAAGLAILGGIAFFILKQQSVSLGS